jgi:uncharacterized protein (DUF952 family)
VIFYHVALRSDWEAALEAGEYRVSTRGRTLDEVGYLHGSFAGQVPGIVSAYYADVEEGQLLLLEIDSTRLTDPVRVEDVAGAEKPFPHIYGPLPVDAVVAVRPVALP